MRDYRTIKLDTPVSITGDGSSIWGPSKGSYQINKLKLRWSIEDKYGELQLFGEGTEWDQYTDNRISKEVKKYFEPYLGKELGCSIRIGWSEQGMQPNHGWSFDVVAEKRNKK